jgi:hypothetical protein
LPRPSSIAPLSAGESVNSSLQTVPPEDLWAALRHEQLLLATHEGASLGEFDRETQVFGVATANQNIKPVM